MKRTLLALTIAVFTAVQSQAQATNGNVEKVATAVVNAAVATVAAQVIPSNSVPTKTEVAKMIKDATSAIPASLKEAAGWGQQIAVALKGCTSALNDGVTATTDQLYKFSESHVGKITVAILVYKFIGKEIIRMVVAISLLIVLIIIATKWFKHLFRIVTEKDGTQTTLFSKMNSGHQVDGAFVLFVTGLVFIGCFIGLLCMAFA